MAPSSTFAERFAYARLVRHYRTGKSPDNAEIGRAVGRTGQWVTKWADSATPPTDYRVHVPLAAFLEAGERWLIDGTGEPPMPDLWESWVAQHRGDDRPTYKRVAERLGGEVYLGSPERPGDQPSEKRKAAGDTRRPRGRKK